jgi:hypothetical protein
MTPPLSMCNVPQLIKFPFLIFDFVLILELVSLLLVACRSLRFPSSDAHRTRKQGEFDANRTGCDMQQLALDNKRDVGLK